MTDFDSRLSELVELRRKRDRYYDLNTNVLSLLRAKQGYMPVGELFIWFADVIITVESDKVVLKLKNGFVANEIRKRFTGMLEDHFKMPIEIGE